ncbi:MAG TPA: RNA polymerase sigma factor RpoD/SigA [Candidatus Methylomirabilis sp.]|jgi:RNA polymerase primary sigma factor|nr:RNA polymerase sigma factor RpoD/SigA [Candidatus Methylomirabilis sp.]
MPRRSAQFYDEITDDALAGYLKRIVRISLLPKERELELAKRIQEGDEEALRQLVEANLRFVVKVAMHYQGCGLSLLDLINEGNLGLLEAGRRFRPEYNVKFITYAVWWIRQAIMQALARGSGAMRLPLRKARLASQLRVARAELAQQMGAEPTDQDLANQLNLSLEEVEDVLRISARQSSLDDDKGMEDRREVAALGGEAIPAADFDLIRKSFREEVDRLLRELKPRERQVIELRFGIESDEPMTLEAVGKRLRLSRERVRQIEEKAKRKLRLIARSRQLQDYLN